MTAGSAFDLGPLSWVKGEIDLALDRATQALQQFAANPGDSSQARFCRNHLHQVRGALAMVGLDGVTQFTDSLEALIADLEEQRQPADGSRLSLINQALASVRHYLEDLIAGEPNQPLRLLDLYRQIAAARGQQGASPTDLFFPDLSVRAPLPTMAPLAPEQTLAVLRAGRARFQKGVLAWLKTPTQGDGASECLAAARTIAGAHNAPLLRTFWWAVCGLFAALGERAVPLEGEIKTLLSRIDQQTRQQMEGSHTVPERLLRDVLFFVAIARSPQPDVVAVRKAFGLDALIPTDAKPTSQTAQIEPLIKRLREIARSAEEAWGKFCAGSAPALGKFREAAASLQQGSGQIAQNDLRRLTQHLAGTAAWLAEQPSRHSDAVAMEVATGILLVANALDNFSHLSKDFEHQVDVMVERLEACVQGSEPPPNAEVPMLDEMTRLAQEKLLVAQVVKEIQSNLGQIEQILDTFFREPTQRDQLTSCQKPLYQVAGALSMLRQDAAVSALMATGARIARFAKPDYQPQASDFEAVASQLSALGFFVEALRSGNPDYQAFVRDLGARRRDATTAAPAPREQTVPASAPLAEPSPPPVAESSVIEPSALAAAPELAAPAVPANDAAQPPAAEAPTAAPPAEVPQLASGTPAAEAQAEIDAELLEIFLEEAQEVLGTIAESLDQIRIQPSNHESLTTIRRAFHTLKGSSRMVGLKDFGEVAWVVEQVHNLWLRTERPASAELFKLVALAHEVFSAWVNCLATGQGNLPDPSALVAMGEAMKGGEVVTLTPAAPAALPAEPSEAEIAISAPAEESPADTADEALTESLISIELPAAPLTLELDTEVDAASEAAALSEPAEVSESPAETGSVIELELPAAEHDTGEAAPAAALEVAEGDAEAPSSEAARLAEVAIASSAAEPATEELALAAATAADAAELSPIEALEAPPASDRSAAAESELPDLGINLDFDLLPVDAAPETAPSAAEPETAPTIELALVEDMALAEPERELPPIPTLEIVSDADLLPVAGPPSDVMDAPEIEAIEFSVEPDDVREPDAVTAEIGISEAPEPHEVAPLPEAAALAAADVPEEFAEPAADDAPSSEGEEVFVISSIELAPVADDVPEFAATPRQADMPVSPLGEEPASITLDESPVAAVGFEMADDAATVLDAAGPAANDEVLSTELEVPSLDDVVTADEVAYATNRETAPVSVEEQLAIEVTDDVAAEDDASAIPTLTVALDAGEPAVADTVTSVASSAAGAEASPELPVTLGDGAPQAEETPPSEPAKTQTIIVSPVLYQIFLDEARTHLATLQRGFGEIELTPTLPTPADMVRAAHTLGSIAGTVGISSILHLGHGLEDALERRPHAAQPDSLEALEIVRQAIAALEVAVAAVSNGESSSDEAALVNALGEIYPPAPPGALIEPVLAAVPAEPAASMGPADEELPEDHLDADLLPIFLEEAADLVSGINERLAMWRDKPDDGDTIHALARLLHTLKGSARMAGAMAIGAQTHALESAVEQAQRAGQEDPARIALLQAQFDDIAEDIDGLQLRGASLPDPVIKAELALESPLPEAAPSEPDAIVPVAEPTEPAELAALPIVGDTPTTLPEDQLDEQLLPIFLDESTELVKTIYEQLSAWHDAPGDHAAEHGLARALHTLKGSARMAGAMSLGALTHALEARVEEIAKSGAPQAAQIETIQHAFDTIAQIIERLQRGESLAGMTIEPPEEMAEAVEASAGTPSVPSAPPSPAAATPAAPPARPVAAKEADTAPRPMLRVQADLVDRLVNDAGELSISRARIEGEMRGLKQAMLDLTENVIRLRKQLREIEIQAETQMQSRLALTPAGERNFDPLELDRFTRFQELTRMMAESVNDVATVQQTLLKNLDQTNAALASQARLNRDLQQELMAVRMVPFSGIAERLFRIVRQTSKEVGKRADLEVIGSQIELDQNILNKMMGPLEHLLRNAVSHGIESPDDRRAAGKPEMGEITLTLKQEGNEVIVTMQDDGAGLNVEKIRAKAIERGLIQAEDFLTERQMVELIFQSGFSTASTVTQVAGRGVGMDVVRSEVADLGGRIEVLTHQGRGTTFRIYLPLTLAVTGAVIVRVGTRHFAVPSAMIDQVMEIKEQALIELRDAGKMSWQGEEFPYHFLPHLLGDPAALPETRRMYWVLLMHSGTQRAAVLVDELVSTQEVVVKNIGPQLARVVGIAGATVLGDGRVLLILNPVALATRVPTIAVAGPAGDAAPISAAPVQPEAAHLPTVLVVDDSLTVRKITSRLLAREGYQVLTAKDGLDALEQMTEFTPDVILSDIEMPRMDGFELARNIRGDERLREVPIIMITSRTADKHRSHASELGVDHYLGKPYQEEELLRLVGDYIAAKKRA